MTSQSPISTAVLDIVLLNEHQESTLHIGEGPQNLALELTNLTEHDLELGDEHGTSVRLTFRPGTLERTSAPTAAGDGWSGGLDPAESYFQAIDVTRSSNVTLKPGVPHRIEISGLVPSPAGGSRSTRVEVRYSDVHVVGEGPVAGRRIVHLAVLHPAVSQGMIAGSIASSGPFEARISDSADVVSGDGPNDLRIVVGADAHTPVSAPGQQGVAADVVSRFTVDASAIPNTQIEFDGQPRSIGRGSWSATGHVVSAAAGSPATIGDDFVYFDLRLTTSAQPGLYPLALRYENFGDRQGSLVLLVKVTAVGVPGRDGDLLAKRPLRIETGTIPPLYVTAPVEADSNGVEFRHSNETQGIGFGYNTIYATGSNADQPLHIKARGSSAIELWSPVVVPSRMRIGGGNLTNAPLFVRGNLGAGSNGIEFRHTNETQGIGFGYNTIYATGSNASQPLKLKARGASAIELLSDVVVGSGARISDGRANAPLQIRAGIGAGSNGIEFRHTNETQGIGFGYNTIYATGSNVNQPLHLKARGTGGIALQANVVNIGTQKGRTQFNVNGPLFSKTTAEIVGRPGDTYLLGVSKPNGNRVVSLTAAGLELVTGEAWKPGGGSWARTSDVRLKEDVRPLCGALDRLLALRSVSFRYRDPAAIGECEGEQVGFLAHQVAKVFPDWVGARDDGYQYVASTGFEALAVAAFRELRAEKDRQIAALERRLVDLQVRLEVSPAGEA